MLLLAIDTSGKQGSIALARAKDASAHDLELIEIAALTGGTFSAQLVPEIAALLSRHAFNKSEIAAFAVASGPGSFTGLRIGLAVVKALAEVLQKPIAPVSLLEACVLSSGLEGKIMAALDAGRGDVYLGEYVVPANSGILRREYLLSQRELASAAEGWKLVTPDASVAHAVTASGGSVLRLEPMTAAAIAQVGWQKIRSGETVSAEGLEANYIRRTDAEMLERIGS